MTISIALSDKVDFIEKNIKSAIAEQLNKILLQNQSNILKDVKSLIPSWVRSQPEIQSLLSNSPESLAGYFGIVDDTSSIVNKIVSSVTESTSANFVRYNANLRGGFELYFQPANFSNLLSLPEGKTIYNGGNLHWLDWLLNKGDSVIITNYQYNPQTGLGRSGLGNMVSGGAFRVPPQFSGTQDNNFITRAFLGKQQEEQITKIFIKYLS